MAELSPEAREFKEILIKEGVEKAKKELKEELKEESRKEVREELKEEFKEEEINLKRSIVSTVLSNNFSFEETSRITGLSLSEISQIANSL